MTHREPTTARNLDSNHYGLPDVAWSTAVERLVAEMPKAETVSFLGTIRPDGTPHAAGIGPLWQDGELYFTTSPGAAKGRQLAANAACTLSTRARDIDLIFEGTAQRVLDRATLERVAEGYRAGGWPATVNEAGDALTAPFSAPSAGPPPWHVFRLAYHTVFGVLSSEPGGAMRWTFTA
jgi:hypothetical protein